MNIKPPGKKTQQHFDDFRSEVNAKYGLADPTDPNRIRNMKTPNHILKITVEATRRGDKPSDDVRDTLGCDLVSESRKWAYTQS
ncbi:hypothetical protein SK355_00930 [Candidatus Fukatsuia symbiotica]|uniref:Uncharacterized protein n=1 Tax=Candidatus Fukatsuia symbiotica TaxID=1878942 RepID=A0A2U8I7K9_9GAMM|nr:hypothetical protein [Candidatus Fukatsuia symbiotica]AWK15108.1 hypothetical protein CCS41_12525 [Candidatus Fukatsuia symbiotica]MEA9443923.1 hypothetical protein [Candidatus Fukatsuia symbiotica]